MTDEISRAQDALRQTGFVPGFDRTYYLSCNPDVAADGLDPIDHYLEYGWKEGRSPSAGFDGNLYLELNPDVLEAGLNPLLHFLAFGLSEGRAFFREELHGNSDGLLPGHGELPGFDKEFYLNLYSDVAASDVDPLEHYLAVGWKEGRRPSAGFDGDLYLALNPDVKASGLNPLLHFVRCGLAEGRAWKLAEAKLTLGLVRKDSEETEIAVLL